MDNKKIKLSKLKGFERLDLDDIFPFGKFKNCRIRFIISTYPDILEEIIDKKIIDVTLAVKEALRIELTSTKWKGMFKR
jgi:hypothetical protein